MGIHDREYIRTKRRPYDGPSSPMSWSFNTWLIVANVAVFVLGMVFYSMRWVVRVDVGGPPGATQFVSMTLLEAFGHFSTAKAAFFQSNTGQTVFGLQFWRFITFQFLHANFLHIFFNMLALWIFGPLVESKMGFKRYAAFYLICGIAGAIMYLILNLAAVVFFPNAVTPPIPGLLGSDPRTPLIGASAGVFGVLMAAAYFRPNDQVVLLFPPIPLKIRTLAYGYVLLALMSLLFGARNAGGEAAHIGGAIAGYFFVRRSHLLHDFFDVFGRSPPAPDSPRARAKQQRSERLKQRARSAGPSDAEVDRILGKVATEGLQSLSEAEKRTLEQASRDKRGG